MVCKNCQSVLDADSQFCPKCGQPVESAPVIPQQQMPPVVKLCPACGRVLAPNAIFCVGCGHQLQQHPQGYEQPPQKKKKSKKIPIIIGIAAALVLAAVLVVGFVFNWFIDYDPGDDITEALENTLDSGSFTVNYQASYEDSYGDTERIQGVVYVSVDNRNRELMAQIDVQDSDGDVVETYAIYDGYLTDGYDYEDISDAVELFFMAYEENFDADVLVSALLNSLSSGDREMLNEFLDMDNLERCVSRYEEKLDDEKWLEKNAGYSMEEQGSMTMYIFEPNIHSFLSGSLDVFETAFQNRYQYLGAKEMLLALREPSKYTDTRLAFGLQRERLARLEMKLSGLKDGLTDGDSVKVNADISNFGSTYVDEDLLAEMLADAQYS